MEAVRSVVKWCRGGSIDARRREVRLLKRYLSADNEAVFQCLNLRQNYIPVRWRPN